MFLLIKNLQLRPYIGAIEYHAMQKIIFVKLIS